MKLKKAIVTGIATAVFIGSVLNVSAAEMTARDYMNALKESGKENLILDVEAYKAAYSDLAAVFGDDRDAYFEHYLTYGIYENRMEGALFDPLTYAEAYGDIKAAYGDNVFAIANHYVTIGITENRTIGTANGYADIAAAKKAGAAVSVPRVNRQIPGNAAKGESAVNSNEALNGVQNANVANGAGVAGSNNVVGNTNNNAAANVGGSSNVSNTSVNTGKNNNTANTSVNAGGSNTASNTGGSSTTSNATTAAANNTGNNSNNVTGSANTANSANNNASSAAKPNVSNGTNYDHVTTIYHDDGETLWRKEYYDENNKIAEYSSITNVDNSTNSYTENVYKWDNENNEEVLQRTDRYENGELVSSETP